MHISWQNMISRRLIRTVPVCMFRRLKRFVPCSYPNQIHVSVCGCSLFFVLGATASTRACNNRPQVLRTATSGVGAYRTSSGLLCSGCTLAVFLFTVYTVCRSDSSHSSFGSLVAARHDLPRGISAPLVRSHTLLSSGRYPLLYGCLVTRFLPKLHSSVSKIGRAHV